MFQKLNAQFAVAGQLAPTDMAAIKAAGYAVVINNRPDGEDPAQPDNARMASAAQGAGLAYHFIPIGRDGLDGETISRTAQVLTSANGPVLAYCRSGARSTMLWAIAKAALGTDVEVLINDAANAGHDISSLAGMLHAMRTGG